MIRCEQDDPGMMRLVAALFEIDDQGIDLFIQVFDQSKISSLCGAKRFAFEPYAVAGFVAVARERVPIHPLSMRRRRQLLLAIKIEVALWRKQWRMRREERCGQEK